MKLEIFEVIAIANCVIGLMGAAVICFLIHKSTKKDTCPVCGGTGEIQENVGGNMFYVKKCYRCDGKGKI